MRDLAKFYQSIMVEDPTSGELVVVPSISCEHSGFGIGATFEMALSYWLMQTVIEAAKSSTSTKNSARNWRGEIESGQIRMQ